MINQYPVARSDEIGSLGVMHLKRIWSAAIASRSGRPIDRRGERDLDLMVLNGLGLGLGLHQTLQQLMNVAPAFEEFELWVVGTVERPSEELVQRLNAAIQGHPIPEPFRSRFETLKLNDPVLTDQDLGCWRENGYVILKNAVDEKERAASENAIWEQIGATPNEPETWYETRAGHGIMVELIQHPAFEINRHAPRIHKAFSQLWGTADLWVSADRCGFHPPQRDDHPFIGPDLHWDVDFSQPLCFGTQGILYLTDTAAEQGALTVVPGFQHRIADWLASIESGTDPQQQDLHALGSVPLPADGGDLIVWHQHLPHGSRPNRGNHPRIVQYINMHPSVSAAE